jgi:uncharacterized protein (DUF1330 family)
MSNYLNPTREQFKLIFDLPLEQPVMMLNLLRFREQAVYNPDDPEAGDTVSGAVAYKRYSEEAGPIFMSVGGTQAWIGRPQLMFIGPESENWDLAFVARYPKAQAFVDMVKNPDYQKAVRHRNAAVADSRLIRCSEEKPGSAFVPD